MGGGKEELIDHVIRVAVMWLRPTVLIGVVLSKGLVRSMVSTQFRLECISCFMFDIRRNIKTCCLTAYMLANM